MTIVIRDPAWRQRLGRAYRMTHKAERKRQRERERYQAEHAAYEARQPQLIKREEMKERDRG